MTTEKSLQIEASNKSDINRNIIKTYDEAINHINLTVIELNDENKKYINLCECDFSQFHDGGYEDCHFDFNMLFHKMGIFDKKKNEIIIPYIVKCCDSIFPSVTIDNVVFKEKINFSYAIFKDNVQIRRCELNSDIQFHGALFIDGLTFQGVKSNSDDTNFYMEFCSIKGRFDFWNNEFKNLSLHLKSAKLFDCKLSFRGNFNEILLDEIISNVTTIIKVEGAKIAKFSISFSSLQGKLYLLSDKISFFNANNSIVEGELFVANKHVIQDVSDRYTARLLKHESIKANDVITSNHFKMLEMRKYQSELKENKKNRNMFEYLNEISILKLNYLSNKHGQYWWQGVIFTFLISAIFYFLFALSTNQVELISHLNDESLTLCGLYWKEVLRYLWLPDTSGIKDLNSGFWSTLIYIIGKILIAYGIYQTIAAFRKYSSNK